MTCGAAALIDLHARGVTSDEQCTQPVQEHARRTIASTCRMDSLIQDLLEYSRITSQPGAECVSLVLIMNEIAGLLQQQHSDSATVPQIIVQEPLPWDAHCTTLRRC